MKNFIDFLLSESSPWKKKIQRAETVAGILQRNAFLAGRENAPVSITTRGYELPPEQLHAARRASAAGYTPEIPITTVGGYQFDPRLVASRRSHTPREEWRKEQPTGTGMKRERPIRGDFMSHREFQDHLRKAIEDEFGGK